MVHLLFVGARRVKKFEALSCYVLELNVEYTRHLTSVKICMQDSFTGKHLICSVTDTSVYAANILICEYNARPKSLRVM